MCAIKKIARQEGLVPSDASTSECLQRFEEVVRTTLPSRMNGAFMWTGFLVFYVSLVVPVSCRVVIEYLWENDSFRGDVIDLMAGLLTSNLFLFLLGLHHLKRTC